jgi:hypothetical protein
MTRDWMLRLIILGGLAFGIVSMERGGWGKLAGSGRKRLCRAGFYCAEGQRRFISEFDIELLTTRNITS